MADSERINRLWNTGEPGEIARDCISLFHSAFERSWHLTNYPEPCAGLVEGELAEFAVHPFQVSWPERGTSGRLDLKIDIHNSGKIFTRELRAAARFKSEPIRVIATQYIAGDLEPQLEPLELTLSALALLQNTASGTATSVDFLNREFPRQIYTLERFPGLDR